MSSRAGPNPGSESDVALTFTTERASVIQAEVARANGPEDLRQAAIQGAVKRVRPKMMTVMAAMMGLLPILWSNGAGADLMKRIAAPMIGGLLTSFVLELLVYPVLFVTWKSAEGRMRGHAE